MRWGNKEGVVNEPPKNIPDSEFAAHILEERALLAEQSGCLNAAERAATRQLLGLHAELVALAQDYRFEKEAVARIGRLRDSAKAWLLAIGALAGVVASIVAIYKG